MGKITKPSRTDKTLLVPLVAVLSAIYIPIIMLWAVVFLGAYSVDGGFHLMLNRSPEYVLEHHPEAELVSPGMIHSGVPALIFGISILVFLLILPIYVLALEAGFINTGRGHSTASNEANTPIESTRNASSASNIRRDSPDDNPLTARSNEGKAESDTGDIEIPKRATVRVRHPSSVRSEDAVETAAAVFRPYPTVIIPEGEQMAKTVETSQTTTDADKQDVQDSETAAVKEDDQSSPKGSPDTESNDESEAKATPETSRKIRATEIPEDVSDVSDIESRVAQLKALLNDDRPEIRQRAAQALGVIGTEKPNAVSPVMDDLRTLQLDSEVDVSKAASEAIDQINQAR